MKYTSFIQGSQMTVALRGEIDHHGARDCIREIVSKIDSYSPRVCILDFEDVTFMDSSGIAVVINALRRMAQAEGRLCLQSIGPQPMKVFKASGIDKIVEIKETVK